MADSQGEAAQGTITGARTAPALADARAASRAATVAELSKAAPATPAPAADTAAAVAEPGSAAGAGPTEAPAAEEATDTAATETAAEAETKPDPETERRLSAVQKAEKRAKEQLAKERAEAKAEHDRRDRELAAREAEVKKFEALKARAKYAPGEVLAELGLSEDDFEPAAKDIYARSKAAAADPKAKDAAIRMQREREIADEVKLARKEAADLKAELERRDQQTKYEQAWQGFIGDVTKNATEGADAPLLKNAIAKNPARAQQTIRETAARLYEETGEWPDAVDVIVAFEKTKRAELADFGIDAPTNTNKPKPPPAAPPKTLTTDMAGATPVPGKAKSVAEQRAETVRLMETGKLD